MKEKGHMIMMRGCRKQKEKPGRIRGMEGENFLKIRMEERSKGYSVEKDPGPRCLLFALL